MKLVICSFVSGKATTTNIALSGYDSFLTLSECVGRKRPFTCKGWDTSEVRTWLENAYDYADAECNFDCAGEREYELSCLLRWAMSDEELINGLTKEKFAVADGGQLQLMEEVADDYEQKAAYWRRMMRQWEEGL